MLKQRIFNNMHVGELVRQGARAIGFLGQQVFDHARMTPAKQRVEITEFSIELVVFLRSDQYYFE